MVRAPVVKGMGVQGDRAKLACRACRRDNKKVCGNIVPISNQTTISLSQCGDVRPCQRCQLRHEDCIHVDKGPKVVHLRCENCRNDNKRCEDVRPCSSCLEEGKDCIQLGRRGRGHGTRVKAVSNRTHANMFRNFLTDYTQACTSCRRDKVRCDGVRSVILRS